MGGPFCSSPKDTSHKPPVFHAAPQAQSLRWHTSARGSLCGRTYRLPHNEARWSSAPTGRTIHPPAPRQPPHRKMRRAEQLCQSAQAALSLTVGKGKLHQQRQQASKCTVSFPRRGGMSTLAFRTDHNAPIFSSHLKAIPVCSSIAEAALAISSVEIPSTTASALPWTALPTVPLSILRMQGSTVFSSHVPE